MSYLVLDNIPLKIKSIEKDPQSNVLNKAYVGGGSSISNRGFKGRKLGLTAHVGKDQIQKVEDLIKKTGPVILTSESQADYNSQYYITEPRLNENKKGIWAFTTTLLEYTEANIVWANFENWNVTNGGGAAGGDTETTNPLQNCPTLQLGDRGGYVGELQTFLKLIGYYVYINGHSLDVDNYFGEYTKEAVQAFQQANGLTPTGIVDTQTKSKMTL